MAFIGARPADKWLADVCRWCWRVKVQPHIENELLTNLREQAETEAIRVFARNLKDLLLAAPAGPRASRLCQCGRVSAPSSVTTKPSRASAMAGRSSCASVNLPEPYFCSASVRPATVPGTPMPSAESRDLAGSGLPSGPRNIPRVAARGAASR